MDEDASSDTVGEVEVMEVDDQSTVPGWQTYVNSLPYQCESYEEMQAKLEEIVGKIYICAKSRNWLQLTTWDGVLQCWLLMKYPMAKTCRAKLVRLYYDLSLLPGIEARLVRGWTDMVTRLLANKTGQKRKLEATDLVLPWKPLWRSLQKELWPKNRLYESTRNMVNILLYLAEQCKRYFPASEIEEMLDVFIPLVTPDSILTMVPVIVSFVPPTHSHLYLPCLFKLWEAFNSSIIDDRLLDLAGHLSLEHVSGPFGQAGPEGGAQFKDVGIWSSIEWGRLMSKGLGSMNVPVGTSKGASSTSNHADAMGNRRSLRIKKTISRAASLARIFVYSMSPDGPIRSSPVGTPGQVEPGYLAGSRALDSLERLMTSTENFFHPSNSGVWSQPLTLFLQHLTSEFCKRMKEEEQPDCKTPISRRLTANIRRAFVTVLRTPSLLAMFSKDSTSANYAVSAIRSMCILEPSLMMPDLLERAYGGLEVVNETHRTTAVLSMLLAISRPLATEKIWLGGQKHILPLLELCIPGIDLNDPTKTVCTTMFIISVVQHMKLGDLSSLQSGAPFTDDIPADNEMQVDAEFPQGTEPGMPALSLNEERTLVRDSTSGFADWVTSLFRRVLALYELLPDEGGKRNTTGGKQEENVLKSVKNMMDIVCLHLSDSLFDLVLKLTYEYGTTNAKANATRAFGQLVACLARAHPEKTINKFLPFCISQIEEELKHGASSIRTTGSHASIPSDTTLHWNMAILRGCFGYGGSALLEHKQQLLHIIHILIDKTKSERGYSGTGRLITRVLHTMAGVYPLNNRFVNTAEWDSEDFDRDHNLRWGAFYEPQNVNIEWHVPSDDEIAFVLQILDEVFSPAMERVEALLEVANAWDSVNRNDFCRYLNVCRAIWAGLPTFMLERKEEVANPCLNTDIECPELLASPLAVNAGFTLTQPEDPRYESAYKHRQRFGATLCRASSALRKDTNNEDHIDAVLGVCKAIDIYLLDYGMGKSGFDSLQKGYTQARDLHRLYPRQKDNSRLVLLKRAQVYHSGRVYMNALYRRRSALHDELLHELVELSLSPYTRVRRQSQAILKGVYSYFVRSTRFTLPVLMGALAKGNDPDRMKGALYVLGDKDIAFFALTDQAFHGRYLLTLLECQHEEKPSIQKLVSSVSQDCLSHLNEEAVHTEAYSLQTAQIDNDLDELLAEFTPVFVDETLLRAATGKTAARSVARLAAYDETVSSILSFALRADTHWRYVQTASRFLLGLLRRDTPVPKQVVKFFLENSLSPQPSIRLYAERAINRILALIKVRTYAKSDEELWFEEWKNPLTIDVPITDPDSFLRSFEQNIDRDSGDVYVDKLRTGFLTWNPSVEGFKPIPDGFSFTWEDSSQDGLEEIRQLVTTDEYLTKLSTFWTQESNKSSNSIDLRSDNVTFIKSLAKMFGVEFFDAVVKVLEPLLSDSDKFKQRAAGEFLAGLIRGAKHWPVDSSEKLWKWTTSRLDLLFSQIKPETLMFWGSVFSYMLDKRDPRRCKPMIDWIYSIPLDFHSDSAFAMTKGLLCIEVLVENFGTRFSQLVDRYANLMFDNLATGYAELRVHVVQLLINSMGHQWRPSYPSTGGFLRACAESDDPLHIRRALYDDRMRQLLDQMATYRNERLPPPRVNQSEYDKTALTVLFMLWFMTHSSRASLLFPYVVPLMPEIFRMTEFNDHPELQSYSTAVLYSLSAVTPPPNYVEPILQNFAVAIKESTSWRLRLHALPALVVFFYRSLLLIPPEGVTKVMDVLLECLSDENVEVREMASKMLSGVIRSSQRQQIPLLKERFIALTRKESLPPRKDPSYATKMRSLHSAVLGLCALMESFPYSVEKWMPPLTQVLAVHATDPPPISTTIRKCASEFKKTHQDTWHKDQFAFDEDQLQSLSTMLVGTSYYA